MGKLVLIVGFFHPMPLMGFPSSETDDPDRLWLARWFFLQCTQLYEHSSYRVSENVFNALNVVVGAHLWTTAVISLSLAICHGQTLSRGTVGVIL